MTTTHARPDRAHATGSVGVGGSTGWTRARRWATWVALGALAVLIVSAAAFYLTGGRWLGVRTPSMGEAAPVGTLVLTRPEAIGDLRIGDVISYRPPPEPKVTYTHRIVATGPDGVRTRGDINGAIDPWTVGQGDLVGKVEVRLWGVGWLARALPVLLLGGLVLWALTRWLLPRWLHSPVRMVGGALLVLVLAGLLHPFAAATQLTTTTRNGATEVALVSTGILPIRLEATNADATPLDLQAGQTGVISITGQPADGRANISLGLHMSIGWWAVLVLFWLSPLLWVLLVGLRPVPAAAEPVVPAPRPERDDPEHAPLGELMRSEDRR